MVVCGVVLVVSCVVLFLLCVCVWPVPLVTNVHYICLVGLAVPLGLQLASTAEEGKVSTPAETQIAMVSATYDMCICNIYVYIYIYIYIYIYVYIYIYMCVCVCM